MPRVLSTLLVLGLLGGTAAAFGITEGLKLERSPVTRTHVDKVFSPVCRCPKQVARIAFTLGKAGSLTVAIVRGGSVVRMLVDGRRFAAGFHAFAWNGRDDAGRIAPDGVYRPRVRLAGRRTILLPNRIALDTRPPRARIVSVRPRAFRPGRAVRVAYRLSERAHPILLVDGRRAVVGRFQRPAGALEWYGKLGGRPLAPGPHRLALAARDTAGNLGRPGLAVSVRIRGTGS